MADQTKKDKDQSGIAESPVSEGFEGRHPAESQKRWAETTLARMLEKSPERPIGAATGANADEKRHARFTTNSGDPRPRLYTQADDPRASAAAQYPGCPRQ